MILKSLKDWGCYQSQNYKIWKQFTTSHFKATLGSLLLSITKLQNLKAIHNLLLPMVTPETVVMNHKTTKFESNSQRLGKSTKKIWSCYQSQNYKIWKQFTTVFRYENAKASCYQSQNYKIWKQFTTQCNCYHHSPQLLSITKLQNLKAIHNNVIVTPSSWNVVINRKTTKFESNSQLQAFANIGSYSCYQSQNYKIWKQFTTTLNSLRWLLPLLSIAKLQNLKAIHNRAFWFRKVLRVVINRKTTKFESNSQQEIKDAGVRLCCYQSQNYKIWKQFTTKITIELPNISLLSIAKLQNLKAIHNGGKYYCISSSVVINHKTTKFESNSQPKKSSKHYSCGCYQSQNYKIWKQFTTFLFIFNSFFMLLSITKLQNLKAIHNVLKPDSWPLTPKSRYQSQNYKIWKQFTT